MFSFQMTANVWVGVGVSLLVTLAIGFFNGCHAGAHQAAELHHHARHLPDADRACNLGLTKLISGTVSTKPSPTWRASPPPTSVFASH